jgi:hypothetical protein
VHGDVEPLSRRQPVDRLLERAVLERRDLPAVLADRVMVVLTAGVGGLVAGGGADVEPANELEPGEQLEGPVDARDADSHVLRPQAVEDLLRGEAAILLRQ